MLGNDLTKLVVCRNILKDEVFLKLVAAFAEPKNGSRFAEAAAALIDRAEEHGLQGNLIRAYVLHLLTNKENIVAKALRRNNGVIGDDLRDIFVRDIAVLLPLINCPPGSFFDSTILDDYTPTKVGNTPSDECLTVLPVTEASTLASELIDYYRHFGSGDMARYIAFGWDGRHLFGVNLPPSHLSDLLGCESQKKELVINTEAFVGGRPANNVLLVGARGTGKSSAVKALAYEYAHRGLRLVQLLKAQLKDLPRVMRILRSFADKRFIIFLDDLSFEESDSEFKYLKSAIDGGVNVCPENVVIYATSNRRHLIRETWLERDGVEDLHTKDGMNEMISLSDRFGIILHYYAPTQEEYLAIIDHKLKKKGIVLAPEELRLAGVQWEMAHSGRNGRIAEQFVTRRLAESED